MPLSATQRTRSPVPAAAASTRRSKRRLRGERSSIARPRPTSSSDSAQRQVAGPARADAADQRARAEVVGLPGVDPLLGAGGDEPDVAARLQGGEAGRERDERADAGRVVLRAGRGRDRVGVRHEDPEAVGGRLERADHVARRPLPGTVNGVRTTVRPRLVERARPPGAARAVRPRRPRGGRRRARARGRRCRRGRRRSAEEREGRGGRGEHRRQGTARTAALKGGRIAAAGCVAAGLLCDVRPQRNAPLRLTPAPR